MHGRRTLALAALAALAACGDTQLPEAVYVNSVDTFTISSITGTPVALAGAYSVLEDRVVRTDQSAGFDFAYLHDGDRHLLVPLDALGLGARTTNPGLQLSSLAFDAITTPPSDGYVTDDSVNVHVGDVLVARSRPLCYLGVPQYARIQILGTDDAEGTITFRTVANLNCGYRSLVLGLPTE